MPLPRKKTFVVFNEAPRVGNYDERPMLPDSIHTQVYLSRNDRPQPFYLICEKDTLIAVFAGTGTVHMQLTSVRSFPLEPGDHVYVPAGAATRLEPSSESIILRYKAQHPGLEAVAWYCESCETELFRQTFDTARTCSQAGYLDACRAYNDDPGKRRCSKCEREHPAVDLAGYHWEELAAQLQS